MHRQAALLSRNDSIKGLRLDLAKTGEEHDIGKRTAEESRSASHSPTSVKKTRIDLDTSLDDSRVGTPSSVCEQSFIHN